MIGSDFPRVLSIARWQELAVTRPSFAAVWREDNSSEHTRFGDFFGPTSKLNLDTAYSLLWFSLVLFHNNQAFHDLNATVSYRTSFSEETKSRIGS
jgi:hypothetical protein